MNSTDRIEKHVLLKAAPARVWRALTDSAEFGSWFEAKFETPFRAGQRAVGQITHPGYEHLTMEVDVVEVVPEERLSYRWHPYAIADIDYSNETPTLVTFTLEEKDGGTDLRVVETGFDKIPLHRRAEAFRMNDGGWAGQVKNIERHVTAS
jgi:uncharacterized protein YndB with AHSA1/START domain